MTWESDIVIYTYKDGQRKCKCDRCGEDRVFPQHFYTSRGNFTTRSHRSDGELVCKFCCHAEDDEKRDAKHQFEIEAVSVKAVEYLKDELQSKRLALYNARASVTKVTTQCTLLETAVMATFECGECAGKGVYLSEGKLYECGCRRMLREVMIRHFDRKVK